jgi:hypothetical protein
VITPFQITKTYLPDVDRENPDPKEAVKDVVEEEKTTTQYLRRFSCS